MINKFPLFLRIQEIFTSLTKQVALTFKVSTFQFIPLSLSLRTGGRGVKQYKTKTPEAVVYSKLQLLFCASIITTNKWRYIVIIYFPTTMSLIALVTKLFWMLLSTATEAEITATVVHDSFVRTRHLTAFVVCMVTRVVVKRANDHSILCGLAFLAVDWNLCVTVAVSSLGTNLSTILLVSSVSGHHLVWTATSSPWRCATSAGSSSRHVERLPRQVVRRVFIITC